ncbi:MAG: hypothetical protein J7J80_07360 [Thermotogae bacterium]|nr:hypothetical protein [Thermotogota bacterium]
MRGFKMLIILAIVSPLLFLSSCYEGSRVTNLWVRNLLYSVPEGVIDYYNDYSYRVYVKSIEVEGVASPLLIEKVVDLAEELNLERSFEIIGAVDGATVAVHTGGIATLTTPYPSQVSIPEKLEGVVHHLESGMLEEGWGTSSGGRQMLNLYFDIADPASPWFFAITSPTTNVEFDLGFPHATTTVEVPEFSIAQLEATPMEWKGIRVTDEFGFLSLTLPDPKGLGYYTVRVTFDSTEVQKIVGETW